MPEPTPPAPTLAVEDLAVEYRVGQSGFLASRQTFRAVEGVTFAIARGETLGLVGESGSGKSTVGRAILRRAPLAAGRVLLEGEDISHARGRQLQRLRARMQLVLQDPYASLNPRMSVADIVAEPLIVHRRVASKAQARARVAELLHLVGLPEDAHTRYPHAFSGGQRQRIGIARALALEPPLIVADEPVSALDVSVRAQVINLMQDLQEKLGLSYLCIAHDLAIVRHISHRIAILYAGRVVEIAGRDAIYDAPKHPYTEALLAAVPVTDPAVQRGRARAVPRGELPDLTRPPPGCRYAPRCPRASDLCHARQPPLEAKAPGHLAACWHPG